MIENYKVLNIADFNAAETVIVFFGFQIVYIYRKPINSWIDTVKNIFFYSDLS